METRQKKKQKLKKENNEKCNEEKCQECNSLKMNIGNMRVYSRKNKGFSSKKELYICKDCDLSAIDGGYEIKLKRGGTITYYPAIISEEEKTAVSEFMDESEQFRQYRINGYREPRVHVLLSASIQDKKINTKSKDWSDKPGPGYKYHGVLMKAQLLSRAPALKKLSEKLAKKFADKLIGKNWGIGVDVIFYRNGKDSINWHADDTQDEGIILTVVIESDERRMVHIRTKGARKKEYEDGDEEIQLIVTGGNAYRMDDEMQLNYEHSLPKSAGINSARKVLIFRDGKSCQCKDNGLETDKYYVHKHLWYGAPSHKVTPHPDIRIDMQMNGAPLSRKDLSNSSVHDSPLRGVIGSQRYGACSIIVANQLDSEEEFDNFDNFYNLSYSAQRKSGSMALVTSFKNNYPVRVTRSSNGTNVFRPPKLIKTGGAANYRSEGLHTHVFPPPERKLTKKQSTKTVGAANYRYDGLYMIRKCEEIEESKSQQSTHKFTLYRLNRQVREVDRDDKAGAKAQAALTLLDIFNSSRHSKPNW